MRLQAVMQRLLALALVLNAVAAYAAAEEAGPVLIVEDGKPHAAVIVPTDADDQTRAAADLLRRYVKASTGADLASFDTESAKAARLAEQVHVGATPADEALQAQLGELDGDGFLIHAADARVIIVGPTPYGTEFGVCEFLERFVGVRWLMPGPHGDDVPHHDTLTVPVGTVRSEPALFSRQFSGLRSEAMQTWGRRNRLHGRVSFHHNLWRAIPPKEYGKSHPHFYPVHDGKRDVPEPGEHSHWQPCFTAKGLAEEAAKNICAYFQAHPEATSFSLGVNDSSGHCECEACQALDPKEPNFLGRRNVSDRYVAWCNAVVERVLKEYPDKRFGCLAYSEVAQAPGRVKVHPAIVPFMTYDRMKWVVPEIRAAGQEATRDWCRASPTVGWYDYIYGTPYCLPRVYFHHQAEYVRWGYGAGVRAWYSEAYPNWGEGPKLYLLLRLLWDPTRDVDAVLADWYRRAVGPEAAPLLAQYYRHWEVFWTKRAPKSDWWSDRGQYLPFYRPDYLAEIDESEIAESRRLLEAVVANAQTPDQKARATLLLRAFEYYEASAVAYLARKRTRAASASAAEAAAALEQAVRVTAMAQKRRRLALREFPKHPVLAHPIPIDGRHGRLLGGEGWAAGSLWSLFGWVREHPGGRVRRRLESLVRDSESTLVREHAGLMLRVADERGEVVSKNPSFEAGADPNADHWGRWVKYGTGSLARSAEAARTGARGIRCTGMRRGGPNQQVPVEAGRYAAVAFVRCPDPLAAGATVTLSIIPRDADGRNLGDGLRTVLRPAPGRWTAMAVAGNIPAKVGDHTVARAMLILTVDGLGPDDVVDVDDVCLYRLAAMAPDE
ncbi:MAG: DUF4838 domain-containing protein [Planctomycetota bacterium]|nr:DUF4838 domain-containing protein [Planctomycetota bacterium]